MSVLIFTPIFLCLGDNPWYHSGAFIALVYPDNEELTMSTLYKQIMLNP